MNLKSSYRPIFVSLVLQLVFMTPFVSSSQVDTEGLRSCANGTQTTKMASYNLLNMNVGHAHKFPNWGQRRLRIKDWIQNSGVDIIGTQEGVQEMIEGLDRSLTDYGVVGRARSLDPSIGEYSAIFYRKSKFEAKDNGDFWLSETPDVFASTGWGAKIPRLVSWVKLKDRTTQEEFYVFNGHFDHGHKRARSESVKLVAQKIQEIAGSTPTVFMGDLNIHNPQPGGIFAPLEALHFENTSASAKKKGKTLKPSMSKGTPDYIFSNQGWGICDHDVLEPRTANNEGLSDHKPVVVKLSLRPKAPAQEDPRPLNPVDIVK